MGLNEKIKKNSEDIVACKKAVAEGIYDHLELAIKYLDAHELHVLNKDVSNAIKYLELAALEYDLHQNEWKTFGQPLPDEAKYLHQLVKRMKTTPGKAISFAAKRLTDYYSMNVIYAKKKGLPFKEYEEKAKKFGGVM